MSKLLRQSLACFSTYLLRVADPVGQMMIMMMTPSPPAALGCYGGREGYGDDDLRTTEIPVRDNFQGKLQGHGALAVRARADQTRHEMSCSWASVTAAPPKVKAAEEPPAAAPARANGVAPAAPRPAAVAAASTAAAVPAAKEAQYEPAPNEIMHITLNKPNADSVLGIRLAGRERCGSPSRRWSCGCGANQLRCAAAWGEPASGLRRGAWRAAQRLTPPPFPHPAPPAPRQAARDQTD